MKQLTVRIIVEEDDGVVSGDTSTRLDYKVRDSFSSKSLLGKLVNVVKEEIGNEREYSL